MRRSGAQSAALPLPSRPLLRLSRADATRAEDAEIDRCGCRSELLKLRLRSRPRGQGRRSGAARCGFAFVRVSKSRLRRRRDARRGCRSRSLRQLAEGSGPAQD